jgi:hypothetical protein
MYGIREGNITFENQEGKRETYNLYEQSDGRLWCILAKYPGGKYYAFNYETGRFDEVTKNAYKNYKKMYSSLETDFSGIVGKVEK